MFENVKAKFDQANELLDKVRPKTEFFGADCNTCGDTGRIQEKLDIGLWGTQKCPEGCEPKQQF